MNDQIPPLSDRELEVLKLVATGATNQQIARDLVISPNTVKVHLRNIFEKLGVQSRTEATTEAIRRGWVWVEGAVVASPLSPVDSTSLASPALADTGASLQDLAAEQPEPLAPPAPPIAFWQRIYMGAVVCALLLGLLLPGWWQARALARPTGLMSDAGRSQVAVAVRSDMPRWTARAALPEARSRLAVVGADSKLYAIGGETPAGVTGQVAIYNPASNGWLPGANKPTPVSNIGAAWLDNRIYVPGGVTPTSAGKQSEGTTPSDGTAGPGSSRQTLVDDRQVTNVLEIYDPQADRWTTGAPLPAPRAAYALAVLNGRLYLFGGWDGKQYRAETFVYDPARDKWTTASPMPVARAFAAAGSLQNQIFVVGGYDGRRELDTVMAYDPTAEGSTQGPWTAKASLNQPRAGLGLVSLANRLYAMGGGLQTPLAYNEQYDVVSGGWSRIESPITEQWRNMGLAALGETIYAVGGWGGNYLPLNEEYLAIYRVLMPVGGTRP